MPTIRRYFADRAASRAAMVSYALDIDPRMFPYFCSATGELGESLPYIIRATFTDWRAFRVLHRWHSTRRYQRGW